MPRKNNKPKAFKSDNSKRYKGKPKSSNNKGGDTNLLEDKAKKAYWRNLSQSRILNSKIGVDPMTNLQSDIQKVLPTQSVKTYICPYCNQEIKSSQTHIVIVPISEPDLRRHWHSGCFERTIQK